MKKRNFWNKKKVLITGSGGFVGTHLKEKLRKLGADVYGVSRSSSDKHDYKENITNLSAVEGIIKKNRIQICYHLAAEALVESGQSDPYNTFKNNITGALNVLECSRKYNLEKIIIASTSHVYGDHKPPYLERFSPRPSRPYETSKTCIDLIAQSYANTFSLPVIIPRFVNTYGPGDTNFNRLIPKTIKSILENKPPLMWGGKARRDYLYIDDVISAYTLLGETKMEKFGKNRIYNFGSNNIYSVQEIIEILIKMSGKDLEIVRKKDERDFEIKIQFSSFKKANRILGWSPKFSIDRGLLLTIPWYKKNLNKIIK
ncbi:MAG TPA: NAD-dependent epimerase/dehydratase family protein [Candidatus Levybacteria bacterium]|nr:NAD-dependent epimerase/dehydratase family protein [Candidatus Levybacteria bacterium]